MFVNINRVRLPRGLACRSRIAGAALSPPQRPLLFVLWGRLGRKKKRARGAFFRLFYFDGDTQREPLRRREGAAYTRVFDSFESRLQQNYPFFLTVIIPAISSRCNFYVCSAFKRIKIIFFSSTQQNSLIFNHPALHTDLILITQICTISLICLSSLINDTEVCFESV